MIWFYIFSYLFTLEVYGNHWMGMFLNVPVTQTTCFYLMHFAVLFSHVSTFAMLLLKDTLLPNFNTDTFIWRVSMLQITATWRL